ncbi:SseB family protein [Aeromicrobium sp. CTD01-1L150]|uniref:SseB family protein n=1 Tax=Aeromicrobium sp. CTD01-1L150 TaxID=3341830 RepID=UPI0035C21FC4
MTPGPSLAEPAFPDDDGLAYPALAEALGDDVAVLSVLGSVRVFVPIVATLGDQGAAEDPGGGAGPWAAEGAGGGAGPWAAEGASGGAGPWAAKGTDKDADMAAVLMTGADGRRALLTFSSLTTMAAWNPEARPVPVWGQAAAVAALAEGASALLLDLGSPHFSVVETNDVQHLAAGDRLVRTADSLAWVRAPGA